MVYATVAAGADRGRDYHILGVPDRLHCQPGAGVACMGLQRNAGQCPGTNLPAVQLVVDSGGCGGYHPGRLAAVSDICRGAATLLPVAAQRGIKTNVCGCKYNHYGRELAGSNRGHFFCRFCGVSVVPAAESTGYGN